MMTNLITFSILSIACLSLAGCVSSSGGSSADFAVVERSKEKAPAWVQGKRGEIRDGGGDLTYVAWQAKLLNLPLGLKELQTSALNDSEGAIRAHVAQLVSKTMSDGGVGTNPPSELGRHISEAVKSFHQENAQISDIYYEGMRSTPEETAQGIDTTYSAFVLVTLPSSALSALMADLGRRLEASRDLKLRHIGALLVRRPVLPTSH